MGLFSTSKKTYVSSTAYNMAGAVADRRSYLKSTVAGAVITGDHRTSIADTILRSQLNGPTFNQKNFYRWAKDQYPEGQIQGEVSARRQLNAADIVVASGEITVPAGEVLQISVALIDSADIGYWAEREILKNNPALFFTAWTCDFIDQTGDMLITYESGAYEQIPVPGFQPDAEYLIVYYTSYKEGEGQGVVLGTRQNNLSSRPLTDGQDPAWGQISYAEQQINETLTRKTTTTTSPPTTPTVETTTQTVQAQTSQEVLRRTVFMGADPNGQPRLIDEEQTRNIWERYAIITDVTETSETSGGTTTTTKVEQDRVEKLWDERNDTETFYRHDYTQRESMFIYRLGAGNAALNALKVQVEAYSDFFPVIPLRRDNKPIDDPAYGAVFAQWAKAYERSIGQDVDSILTNIEDNDSIADVDHCTLMFGVELNTEQKHGLRYLYAFFKGLMTSQASNVDEVEAWIAANTTYDTYTANLLDWEQAQTNQDDTRYGTPRPAYQGVPQPDLSTLTIRSDPDQTFAINHHFKISWLNVNEITGTGLGKAGAKQGDLWWEVLSPVIVKGYTRTEGTTTSWASLITKVGTGEVNRVKLYWQDNAGSFKALIIHGLVHENIVYDGKAVTIFADEAINSSEETGFVLPLHYPTLKLLPPIHANELALSDRVLIFNSYQVVKTRWYQKGIFKILIVVVAAIVVAVVFPASIGILGSNAFVGASLGFSGTAALVAGAVANAIAAIIISKAISTVAVGLFGEKVGAIVAAIASFIVFNGMQGFEATGNFNLDWGQMMRIENIMGLTNVTSNALQGYANARVGEIQDEMTSAAEDYEEDVEKLAQKSLELLGGSAAYLDPLKMFTELQDNTARSNPGLMTSMESTDTFINRTLMNGSSFIEVQMAMIENYADITLTLPEPVV
jgi:hypothetical protein